MSIGLIVGAACWLLVAGGLSAASLLSLAAPVDPRWLAAVREVEALRLPDHRT